MKVKICGLRRRRDVEAAICAGADMVGFIFVPGTPRAVDPASCAWIREVDGAETVGVFRNASWTDVVGISRLLHLDRVQLHGDEPDEWISHLEVPTIRRVATPDGGVERLRVETLLGLGALPLVDPGGGDGVAADWCRIGHELRGLDFGLAGGLRPDNVAEAIREAQPCFVDVSSGIELSPGVKDLSSLRRFVDEARSQLLL